MAAAESVMSKLSIEGIYERHGHSVLRRARQILGNEQEARDVLQEIFVSLLDRPEQFEGRSSVLTWLYAATTHRCLNRIRNRTTRQRLLEERVQPAMSEAVPSSAEASTDARRILASVPPELAEVAIYYYFDELTQREIADLIGCTRRNVGYLLARFNEHARGRGTHDGISTKAS